MSMGHAGAYDKDLFVVNHPARSGSGEPPLGWAAAVPLVSDTAYPRLEPAPSPAEVVRFTPTLAEIAFIHRRTRQPGPRLALLVRKRGKSPGGQAGAQRALTRSGRRGTAGASGIASLSPR